MATANEPNGSTEWGAETLRVTAFYETAVDAKKWWEKVAQRDLAIRGPLPPPIDGARDEGEVDEGVLALHRIQNSTRIDWLLTPKPPSEPTPGLPLGPITTALSQMLERLRAWTDVTPPVKRLAIGGLMSVDVPSLEAGVTRLGSLVPGVSIAPADLREVSVHLVRLRQTSEATGALPLNRSVKWSVDQVTVLRWTVEDGHMVVSQQVPPRLMLRAEFDINTRQEMAAHVSPERVGDVLREMGALVLKAAEQGDLA